MQKDRKEGGKGGGRQNDKGMGGMREVILLAAAQPLVFGYSSTVALRHQSPVVHSSPVVADNLNKQGCGG